MQADFALELGHSDEVLEIPWASADGCTRYYDLKNHPQDLARIEEASRVSELAEFLARVNSAASILESAKCDVWTSTEMYPEEDIFNAHCKFGSYVDLLFADEASRISLAAHQDFARRITDLLKRVPEIPASAEFLVRRCFYHVPQCSEIRDGFYLTQYLFGYGDNETQARQQWAIAIKLVENAIRQIAAVNS